MARAEGERPRAGHRFHVSPESLQGSTVRIKAEQARQIFRVLRLRAGDTIRVFDGSETEYQVALEVVSAAEVCGRIVSTCSPRTEAACRLWLAVPLLKSDKLEWVIQKGVELGVSGILLIRTRRAVAQPDLGRMDARLERYRRIAREAVEQCGRLKIPTLEGPIAWGDAIPRARSFPLALIAHEGATMPLRRAVDRHAGVRAALFFTGPEGGFAPEEVAAAEGAGILPVTLGARILRAETAALAGMARLLDMLEDELLTLDRDEPAL